MRGLLALSVSLIVQSIAASCNWSIKSHLIELYGRLMLIVALNQFTVRGEDYFFVVSFTHFKYYLHHVFELN